MRRAALSILLAAALLIPASARAAAPTLLSLEQDCLQALATSTTPAEMADTYCGAFLSGYVSGFLYANTIAPRMPQNGTCTPEWKTAYKHIKSRICMPAVPMVKEKGRYSLYQVSTALLSLRIGFLKENGTPALTLSAVRGAVSEPGFCAVVADNMNGMSLPPVNPALRKAMPLLKIDFETLRNTQSGYASCTQDIKGSRGKNAAFRKTKCGAEMEGLLIGMTSVDYNTDKPAFSPACEKEIGRQYANLDMRTNFCIGKNTDALAAARAMIRAIDSLPEEKREALKHRSFIDLSDELPRFLCADIKKKPTGKKK